MVSRRWQDTKCIRDLPDAEVTLDGSRPEGLSCIAVRAAKGIYCRRDLGREVLAPCIDDVAGLEGVLVALDGLSNKARESRAQAGLLVEELGKSAMAKVREVLCLALKGLVAMSLQIATTASG